MSSIWPEYIHRDLPLTKRERKVIHRDAWSMWWPSVPRSAWTGLLGQVICCFQTPALHAPPSVDTVQS
jgi:hypothetical protein